MRTYSEIEKRIFGQDSRGNYVDLSFHTLRKLQAMRELGMIKSASHQAFVSVYVTFVNYLWKYGKYELESGKIITQEEIKVMSGSSPSNTRYDYLIKRGGNLDIQRITETSRDFPVGVQSVDEAGNFELLMSSSLVGEENLYKIVGRKYYVKKPVSENSGYRIRIKMQDCLDIMSNKKLGSKGFMLYCWLRFQEVTLGNGFQVDIQGSEDFTGFTQVTLRNIYKELEQKGFLRRQYRFEGVDKKKLFVYLFSDFSGNNHDEIPTLVTAKRKRLEELSAIEMTFGENPYNINTLHSL